VLTGKVGHSVVVETNGAKLLALVHLFFEPVGWVDFTNLL